MSETVIKNLQSLLRSEFGDELIIENHVMKDLLPPGENYGSKIVDLRVSLKKTAKNPENLHLVAKLLPPNEEQRKMLDFSFVFKKEIFMYSKILPFYRKLAVESGIASEKAEISPKYCGSRLSQNSDDSDDFDEDAVLLLDNLKPKGYYCTDRRSGCDLEHAEAAIRAIAKFHAFGIAAKVKEPEFFEIMKERAKFVPMANPEKLMLMMQGQLLEMAEDPDTREISEILVKGMKEGGLERFIAAPVEPWSSIVHTDCWANNILYHRNEKNEVDDVKLIDYQNYLFLSPMRDLAFFIACGLDHETVGHVDELIDLYYETLIQWLKTMKCETREYCRESFEKTLGENAFVEFPHALSMLRIITADVDPGDLEARDIFNVIVRSGSEMYKMRMKDMVGIYARKGWFKK